MRIHLLAPPNAQTTRSYSLDGFCAATIKFARILKSLGHTVFLYASEENDAPCDELIPVISKEEQQTILGKTPYQYAAVEHCHALWALSNARMIRGIASRKESRDLICTIGGISQKAVADAHPDLMCVEYSIGYVASFAPYRVYESHIWRHCTHGYQDDQQGRSYDAVIPYFFDETEFPFCNTPEPYLVYVGRLTPKKGIATACLTAEKAGLPLKVIGHGDTSLVTHGAEYLGALDDAARNECLSRATAILCPTQYLEPFGAVAVEAQLCGTPVISTDFGAFVETVERGRSGFRCNTLGEFVRACREVPQLDRQTIRDRAIARYSMNVLQHDYQRYFDRLQTLWGDGWYSLEPDSKEVAPC